MSRRDRGAGPRRGSGPDSGRARPPDSGRARPPGKASGAPAGASRGPGKPSFGPAKGSAASARPAGRPGASRFGDEPKRGPREDAKRGPREDAKRGPREDAKRGPREEAKRAPRGESPKGEHTSPRVAVPRGKPRTGTWVFTSREDATDDLLEELTLALGPASRARVLEPSLVEAQGAPTFEDGTIDVTFGRQGFPVQRALTEVSPSSLAAVVRELVGDAATFELAVWAPDSDQGNRRVPTCASLEEQTLALLEGDPGFTARRVSLDRGARHEGTLVQGVLRADGSLLVGSTPISDAVSWFHGGRARMRVGGDRPSRAARKIEEALAWMGLAPGPGEVCVDLGAAPGGWSWQLLERRARVIAVDPAGLRPDVAAHRGMRHEKASAFQYEPDEPVEWLFCDMAWRPLEAAQLLAKWGRRRWARMLVANLKLPMKQKARIVEELRAIVHGGGWRRLRTRQLYHDRDEITLVAF